jgi:hypothetical protein
MLRLALALHAERVQHAAMVWRRRVLGRVEAISRVRIAAFGPQTWAWQSQVPRIK